MVFETIALTYLYTCLPTYQWRMVREGKSRHITENKFFDLCVKSLPRAHERGVPKILKMASNTKAVPGASGLCLERYKESP